MKMCCSNHDLFRTKRFLVVAIWFHESSHGNARGSTRILVEGFGLSLGWILNHTAKTLYVLSDMHV